MNTLELKETTFNAKLELDEFSKMHQQGSYNLNKIVSKELFGDYGFIKVTTNPRVTHHVEVTIITTYEVIEHDDLTNALELVEEEVVDSLWAKHTNK
jgi:hypothetical protein